MREILFRGKRIDNGEWAEGFLMYNNVIRENDAIYVEGDYVCDLWLEWKIDPATVGQYTGLKDKNGKRIFEGDKCKTHNRCNYGIVLWDDCAFRIQCCCGEWFSGYIEGDYELEIIGNIHDKGAE